MRTFSSGRGERFDNATTRSGRSGAWRRLRRGVSRPLLSNGVLLTCVLVLAGVVLWQRFVPVEPPRDREWPSASRPTSSRDANSANSSSDSDVSTRASAPRVVRKPVAPAGELAADERATIDLFAETAPSVVHITTHTLARDYSSLNVMEIPRGNGSGFIWDENGHIVTNYHVIEGAGGAQVMLADRSTWPADLIGVAPDKDLAVLRIKAPAERLYPLNLGTSDNLQVGQKTLAIGNPFGLDQTLTTGVVSAVGREIQSRTSRAIKDVIQTDAAINPGNSGGPLLDSSGRLIGMTTAIVSPSGAYAGIGFAIPADTVSWVVPELIAHGKIIRPSLALAVAPESWAQQLGASGVLVLNVEPDSSAAEAGIRPTTRDRSGNIHLGDVIIAIDGQPVQTASDLLEVFEQHNAGDEVVLTVLRDEEEQEVAVVLEQSSDTL